MPNAPSPGTLLCLLSDIADGGAKMMSLEPKANAANPAPFRLILLRSGKSVVAYINRCAHFGVPLSEKPEHLRLDPHVSVSCNVHYARYRWRDGYCDLGDCEGESLISVPVSITTDDKVIIAANPSFSS